MTGQPVTKKGQSVALSTPLTSASLESLVIDDPCWGSPSSCSLSHLLKRIDRSSRILKETNDFVVLNKPADLRMDGVYPATVHKLLTYWFPPPPHVWKQGSTESDGDTFDRAETDHEKLLQYVSHCHQYKDTENALRPCHQLDYATSGVLLIARNKAAANAARLAFEQRQVKKSYLAVLHGHVDFTSFSVNFGTSLSSTNTTLPVLTEEQLQETMHHLEHSYKKIKRKRRSDTFLGFQPAHSLFQNWKMNQRRTKDNKNRRNLSISPNEWKEIWSKLDSVDCDFTQLKEAVLSMNWKEVKSHPHLMAGFQRAADEYNRIIKTKITMHDSAMASITMPMVFQVSGDDDASLYVFTTLAEPSGGEFAMHLPPNLVSRASSHNNSIDKIIKFPPSPLQTGSDDLDYKPALTKLNVLNHTYFNGYPVTKVRLEPRTGRRHQLRVHTALLGHAILGDQTYQPDEISNFSSLSTTNDNVLLDLSLRMCLHSQILDFPFQKNNDMSISSFNVLSNDPFSIIDGKLTFEPL